MNRFYSRVTALSLSLAGLAAYSQVQPVPSRTQTPSQTELIAASCAACHGTEGHSVGGTPVLAGLDRDHFIAQMQQFAAGSRPATVMHRHSRGLTDQQLRELADFYARQPR